MRLRLNFLILPLLALVLAACSAPPANSWPGLTLNGDTVLIANNNTVSAINLADGKEKWFSPATANSGTDLFFAEPAVSEDVLVVGSEGPTGQFHGAVFGLDLDGTQKWCLAFDQNAARRLSCPLVEGGAQYTFEFAGFGVLPPVDNRVVGGIALADGVAYFGTANNDIYAVQAESGTLQWHIKAEGPVWATPLVVEDVAYIASLDHNLYALNVADGSLRWKQDLGASLGSAPVLSDGVLYIGTFGKEVHALDANSGAEQWAYAATNWVWGSPVLAEGTLYFADLSGGVFAVNAATGTEIWKTNTGAAVRGSPALAGKTLILGDKAGNIHFLDSTTGQPLPNIGLQAIQGGGQLLTTPLVVPEKGLVLFATYQGTNLLMAYTTEGAFRWPYKPNR